MRASREAIAGKRLAPTSGSAPVAWRTPSTPTIGASRLVHAVNNADVDNDADADADADDVDEKP